jgi:hypothetical protein
VEPKLGDGRKYLEHREGIEPSNTDFADSALATSPSATDQYTALLLAKYAGCGNTHISQNRYIVTLSPYNFPYNPLFNREHKLRVCGANHLANEEDLAGDRLRIDDAHYAMGVISQL